MELIDIVMKLTGPVDPVGDSHVDRKRLENLKALCDLTGRLLEQIEAVADATDYHLASVKAAKDHATTFLVAEGAQEDAHPSTGGMPREQVR